MTAKARRGKGERAMFDPATDGDDPRDGWCTPKWLADAIGAVDLDPCSNARSHVQALASWCGATPAEDGLARAHAVRSSAVVYLNPPYSRGQVIRWVRAYRHTEFVFLLRLDPSTEWWALLMREQPMVWMPPKRIAFEPPPKVKASTNPFPHCIVARHLPAGLLATGYPWAPMGRDA